MVKDPTPDPVSSTTRSEALFADFLARRTAGEPIDFEELCASNAEHAKALRAALESWERARRDEGPHTITLDGVASAPSAPGVPSAASAARGAAGGESLLKRLGDQPPKAAHYKFEGEIARGGMGAILKVWDENLRRHLAMKVILGEAGDGVPDPANLARFLEEAQITGQLDHPGIVPVHELGLDADGRVFFTMKLVKGRDLKHIFELVAEGKEGWNETRALSVILKVCEAMGFAHAKGVIHRDLKPANVMVGNYGEVYVMDWGLARVLGHKDNHDIRIRPEFHAALTSIHTERRDKREEAADSPIFTMGGDVMGTPAYMPPEQAFGEVEKLSARSDVYAIGSMLYHLLARHMPYMETGKRVTSRTVLTMVLQGPPAPLTSQRKDLPAELVAICEKAMERDAADRYPDTIALAEDLRAYLENRVVKAYETGALAELKKWVGRNRGMAAASVAALVIAIGGSVSFMIVQAKSRADLDAKNKDLSVAERMATQKADDVLSLSASRDLDELVKRANDLWPAEPKNIGKLEQWLRDATLLVQGREADLAHGIKARPSLAEHKHKLDELRAKASPLTEKERADELATHPRAPELALKRAKLTWMSRMLGDSGTLAVSEEAAPADDALIKDANTLKTIAFSFVDSAREMYGHEARGLALARRAVSSAKPNERAGVRDTLAWALFANARFEDALTEEGKVLEEASAGERPNFELNLTKLQTSIAEWKLPTGDRAKERTALAAEVAELEKTVSERRTWVFKSDEDAWWQVQLSNLVAALEAFASPDPRIGTLKSMEQRLLFARGIEERSVSDPQVAKLWADAIASIRNERMCPKYRGFVLTPQVGLVPIGMDAESGLWEFSHLQTGEIAERKAGKIELKESLGLVFVLLPGATFRMGEQNESPTQPHYADDAMPNAAPVQEVSLEPYFISKYEMTQGQWLRFTGHNPSQRQPENWDVNWSTKKLPVNLLLPVESVSRKDCSEVLTRLGLVLPTEAQWECAARAGTDTTWYTGNEPDSWQGKMNIFDVEPKFRSDPREVEARIVDLNRDDGWRFLAPVGTFPANAFGLHDMMGNVAEWCRDDYFESYELPALPGDGERKVTAPIAAVFRGGSYSGPALFAHVAARHPSAPEFFAPSLGLRPVRRVMGR